MSKIKTSCSDGKWEAVATVDGIKYFATGKKKSEAVNQLENMIYEFQEAKNEIPANK